MTAHIINIAPEIETAIHEGSLTKIEITAASMKLADGVFTLKAKDLLPPKIDTAAASEKPKTGKEGQRAFTQRKKEAGFRKDWLHQSILTLAEELGGQESIATEMEKLRARLYNAEKKATYERLRADAAEAKIQRLKLRPWWRLWR